MGEKGARQSAAGAMMADRLREDLAELGDVATKKMFGGHGVFVDDVMFALVDSSGGAFLKTDTTTVARFEAAGSTRHGRMPYWRIPQTVLEDHEQLIEWAAEARAVAQRAKK